jgi:hypothetical protein
LGLTTACTSTPVRRDKNIVPTVEKAIAIMEANKNKRKKPDWKKILNPNRGVKMCVYIQLQYCGNLEASEEPNNNIYCQNDILLPICFSFFFFFW